MLQIRENSCFILGLRLRLVENFNGSIGYGPRFVVGLSGPQSGAPVPALEITGCTVRSDVHSMKNAARMRPTTEHTHNSVAVRRAMFRGLVFVRFSV